MGKQQQRVLDYMNEHGSITSMEAFWHLGTTRLSAVIFNLKKKGYNIKSVTESRKNRYNEPIYYSRYSMVNSNDKATV